MKKILFNILKFGILILGCILLGFSIYNCTSTKTTREFPMPFGVGAAVVVSGSMEPTLSIDDLVIVKKTDNLNIDDLIVFYQDRMLVVHRLVEITESGELITKGDANNTTDEPIKLEDVKGKVVKTFHNIGKMVDFFKSPIVVIIVLGVAFLLMEYSFKKDKEEKSNQIELIKEEIKKLQEK